MGKQPKVSKSKVDEIRLKIRAVVKNNRELQAKVDEQLAGATPKNKQAARQDRRKAYSAVIRNNRLLSDEVKKIFQIMTP